MMSKTLKALLLMLGLGLLATASALPLWLDAPSRSNKFDPKSGLAALPTNTAVVTTSTFTKTATQTYTSVNTATPTYTITPTSTVSPTPTSSNTAAGTFTETPSFTNSPTPSATPSVTDTFTPSPTVCTPLLGTVYEGFEAGTANWTDYFAWGSVEDWSFCTNGDGVNFYTVDSTDTPAGGGANSWKLTITNDPTTDCWMIGSDPNGEGFFGLYASSLNGGAGGPLDFSCAQAMTFWAKSDQSIDFNAYITEDSSAACPDACSPSCTVGEESYKSSTLVTVPGDSTWRKVTLPISTFFLDDGTPCDGVLDMARVKYPWFHCTNAVSAAHLWMDNIGFE